MASQQVVPSLGAEIWSQVDEELEAIGQDFTDPKFYALKHVVEILSSNQPQAMVEEVSSAAGSERRDGGGLVCMQQTRTAAFTAAVAPAIAHLPTLPSLPPLPDPQPQTPIPQPLSNQTALAAARPGGAPDRAGRRARDRLPRRLCALDPELQPHPAAVWGRDAAGGRAEEEPGGRAPAAGGAVAAPPPAGVGAGSWGGVVYLGGGGRDDAAAGNCICFGSSSCQKKPSYSTGCMHTPLKP